LFQAIIGVEINIMQQISVNHKKQANTTRP